MTTHWLVDQGDFAIQASLMVGGYLAAAVLLYYLPTRTNAHHGYRLAASIVIVLAALFPVLSPFATIIGVVAAIVLWAVSAVLSGPRMAAAHLAALVIAAVVVGAQSVTNTWVDYWRDDPFAVVRIGVYLAAYALVTAPAAYATAWLLNRINLQQSEASRPAHDHVGAIHESPAQPLAPAGAGEEVVQADHARLGSPSRGRVIGVLERLIILTLGLLGQWQAIGLVVAAKSIARFRNLEDRSFAEYYLVGTLSSLLIAVLVAAAALAIT